VAFNLTLSSLRAVTAHGFVDSAREAATAGAMAADLRVKSANLESPVGTLSGGNQQKVVIGKALLTRPRVLLLDEPTRGIDVGAKLEVYGLINRLSEQGQAVVLVSSELPELMAMSDRILMLHDGRIGGEFGRGAATQEALLAAAMGMPPGRAA
jgi:D-xylose transport system ATP-binding protein